METIIKNIVISLGIQTKFVDETTARVQSAINADRGQGKVHKTSAKTGNVKISVGTKNKVGHAGWTESESRQYRSEVTKALRLEAAIAHWQDGVKRGYYAPDAPPVLIHEVRQWIITIAERIEKPEPKAPEPKQEAPAQPAQEAQPAPAPETPKA